jgi:putative phosphoesterase
MRILLLADIHGNWPALQAIEEPHDLCLVLGDLVDYGVEPVSCIGWVRGHTDHCIRGNHDHGMAQNVTIAATSGLPYLAGLTRTLTRGQLEADDIRYLASLPITRRLTLDDKHVLMVHGTPRDPLDEYGPPDVDFWTRRLERVDADIVLVGHTHVPYSLRVGHRLVINPGSVGWPRDGDPRASYAILENGNVELKRVEYPVEETVKTIEATQLPDAAKQQLAQLLRTGTAKNGK